MASSASGQPPPGLGQLANHIQPTINYAAALNTLTNTSKPGPIDIKPVTYLHGEPSVTWTKKEFEILCKRQNLQYALVAKFSYGRPDVHELRRSIPTQLEVKGPCTIGLLEDRHILVRLSLLEDYATLASRPWEIRFRNRIFPVRFLIWDPWFQQEEETTIAIAWISFLGLPTNLFDKESLFSLANAVGRPLVIDKATDNQTRPSCARVKVEVDLMKELPKRVQINLLGSRCKLVMEEAASFPGACRHVKSPDRSRLADLESDYHFSSLSWCQILSSFAREARMRALSFSSNGHILPQSQALIVYFGEKGRKYNIL